MKVMLRRYLLAGAVVMSLVGMGKPSLAGAVEAQWVLVDSEPGESDFYYDKSTLARSTPKVLSVRVKVVYGPEGKADALEQLKDKKTYGNLKETLYLYE